jgi:Fe-S-cluster containining protein
VSGDPIARRLTVVYEDVDRRAGELHALHAARTQCRRGCSACCEDDLTVFEVEAARIRERHGDLLAEGVPHAEGACAFLDGEGACRIYADRPYVCRTQGLPLRWLDEGDAGEIVELRDICPLNEAGRPIEELDADDCWTIGPVEETLARLEVASGEAMSKRVALRKLFTKR